MFKFNRDQFINLFIEFSYLAIAFLVPIYFSFFLSATNPFDLHKISIFKIFVFLLIFWSGFKLFFSLAYRRAACFLMRRYFFAVVVLVVFLFSTLLWSVDVYNSLFGSLSRQMGVLSYLFFILFSFLVAVYLSSNKNKAQKIKNILVTISLSSFLVSVYAIFQYFGIDFLIWAEPANITKRAMSSLGQPNFLGSFLVLIIPLSLYLFIIARSVFSKSIYFLLLLLNLLALIFSASRGAWVALFISFFLFLFLFYFKKNRKVFYWGLFFLILILAPLFVSKNYLGERFRSAFDFSRGSSSARVVIWNSSLDFIKSNPWGLGLENQKEAIIDYYQVDWAKFTKVNTIFDRAHNIFLDILLTVGVLGLLIFLIFYLFIFRVIFRSIKGDKNNLLNIFLFFSISAYLISLFFNFAVVVTEIYFFLLMAIVFSLNFNFVFDFENNNSNFSKNKNIFKYSLTIILFYFCFVGIFYQIRNIKADYYFNEAKKFFYNGEIPSAMLTFSYFLDQKSNFSSYYYNFISITFDNFNKLSDKSSEFLALEQIKQADSILDNKFNNNSFEFSLAKAQSSALLGNFSTSDDFFGKLKYRSKYYPDIYNKEAKTNYFRGNISGALDCYYQALFLLPEEDEIDGEINLKSLRYYKSFIKSNINFLENI